MPTPTPVLDGTGTVDEGTAVVGISRRDFDVDGVSMSAVDVSIEADVAVSGFSIVVELPIDGFDVGPVVISDRLWAAGFDGRPRIDEERGLLTLTGGLASPLMLHGDRVVSVDLSPRVGAPQAAREARVTHALVRDAYNGEMTTEAADPANWRLPSVELSDINGDGTVGPADVLLLVGAYGTEDGGEWFDARADLNGDGLVDLRDLAILGAGHE